MEKYLQKFEAADYDHCIIKEELIISDDEKDDSSGVKTGPIDECFVDTDVEKNKCNGQIKWKSGLFRNKNINPPNGKRSTLDLFLKSENADSNEQSKILNNVRIDEKPSATGKAACTSDNIDELYKKLGKSHCHKCNVKRAVIRQKARCLKCKSQLTYSCETCRKTYSNFSNLGYHLKRQHTSQHTSQIYTCLMCQKTFASRNGIVSHQKTHYGYADKSVVVVQQCAKCGKVYESKHSREHKKVCGAEGPLKCDKCPYTTTYPSNLQRHVHNKHTDFKKKCDNCNKTFTNRKTMLRHLRVYCNKTKRIECHHCGHKTYRKDQIVRHLDQAHFGGLLKGKLVKNLQMPPIREYCDTTLDQYERMKDHLRQCVSEPLKFCRLYKCHKCNLSYCHLKHLNRHEKIHHPSEPPTKMYKNPGYSKSQNFVAKGARTRRTSNRA